MARENRILGIFPRRETRGLPEPEAKSLNEALLYEGKKVYVNDTLAMQLSAVYRAVDLISNAVAMLPVTLFAAGGRVDSDLSYTINYEPSNLVTHYQLFKSVVIDILQKGNAFLWIRRRRNQVEELRYLKPEEVTILYNEDTNRKRYRWKDKNIAFDDMLHFMNYTADGIKGISVLENAGRCGVPLPHR